MEIVNIMLWFIDKELEAILFHCEAVLIVRTVKASYTASYSSSLKDL